MASLPFPPKAGAGAPAGPSAFPASLKGLDTGKPVGRDVRTVPTPSTKPVQKAETQPGGVAAYMPPSEGPFECDNCQFYSDPNGCTKPEVIQELGPNAKGLADVEPDGCCNFFKKGAGASSKPNESGSAPPTASQAASFIQKG